MTVKPKFFDAFKCIADKCPDTCCAGWEIDVDEGTLSYYGTVDGDDGDFVRSKLIHGDDGCTKLCLEGERCGCLREDGLCELILRLGEGGLCDICREHPRFYTGGDTLTEEGLGLCCPEAARLWLESPCEFVCCDDGDAVDLEDERVLMEQMIIIDRLTSGEGALGERLAAMIGGASDEGLYPKLRALYASIEVLDENFPKRFAQSPVGTDDERMRRLAAYFVYRYYFELGEELCLKFTAVSLIMIAAMGGKLARDAKDYSKEVEYDTDNLGKICEFLGDADGIGELCRLVLC